MQTEPLNEGTRKLELTFIEKAVVGVVSFIIIGLLGWIGATSSSTSTRIAIVETRLELLSKQVEDATSDRYSSSQASADLKGLSSRIDDHEGRLRSIEERQIRNYRD